LSSTSQIVHFTCEEGLLVPTDAACRHVLFVAPQGRRAAMHDLVPRERWEAAGVDSLQQALFVLKVNPCDVVVVDSTLAGSNESEALSWLIREAAAPIVLVGDAEPEVVVEMLEQGAVWLPGESFLFPSVLVAILDQEVRLSLERLQAAGVRSALCECQARIQRLLGLLWEATPAEGPTRWFTQRYMLERLDEEVARSNRYGAPLSVVLVEIRPERGERLCPEQAHHLARWLADCIGKGIRRCDLAGQYGLHGFMLLLPQSSADQAREACKRMRGLLAAPPQGDLPPVRACFGLASVSSDGPTVQRLLRCAEERLEQEQGEDGH
jgi:diguanylate cyclase (GGDEF)-like protein